MAMDPLRIGINRVNNADDAQKWVTKYHDAGFQQIKIYSSDEVRQCQGRLRRRA